MNQVNSDYEQINKRVKALKFQLKDFDSRNSQLQSRLNGLRRLTPNRSNKSPIELLQENLHLDRRQIMEYFQPIKEQEFQYIRNQRIKTEQQLFQARIDDIQQKQNRVKQIEKFQIDLPLKLAKYQEQKICQARQKQNQFLQENQLKINQKLKQIERLKREESQVIDQINLAKQTEVQMSHKLNKLITNSNGVLLPSIQNTRSTQSSKAKSGNRTPIRQGMSPFQNSAKVFERLSHHQDSSAKISRSTEQQKACQTSFVTDQTPSLIYSMNYDSYQTQKRTLEKSLTNFIAEDSDVDQSQKQKQ